MNNNKVGQLKLGVNVDHIATLRQARGVAYPDPVTAALKADQAGADSITMHLREDRRHIQKEDIYKFSKLMKTHLNLEMAITEEMVAIAINLKPNDCCLVPEKREELTTEGGLDVLSNINTMKDVCNDLKSAGIRVSLFIDPDCKQIEAALGTGAPVIEIHTGAYADASHDKKEHEYERILEAVGYAKKKGFIVHAGHGLNYNNVVPIAKIPEIEELNIGHSIVAYAAFKGLDVAVSKMKNLMNGSRH